MPKGKDGALSLRRKPFHKLSQKGKPGYAVSFALIFSFSFLNFNLRSDIVTPSRVMNQESLDFGTSQIRVQM